MKNTTGIEITTVPRDMRKITDMTGNLYQSVVVLSKRAHQLAIAEKTQITEKLAEFAPRNDSLEEIFDNREQMEISAHFERQPKPTLVAVSEFLNGKVYYRIPEVDTTEDQE